MPRRNIYQYKATFRISDRSALMQIRANADMINAMSVWRFMGYYETAD